MTDREKQIEEMAMSIAECNETTCENCALKCSKYITCEILHDNGYRKMDEITLKLDLGDRSAEEIQQIAEAFNKVNEEEITKRVAKEIYKRVDEFRKSPELNPRDSYDCNALDAYNNVCKFINRKYGVEIEE